MVSCLAGGDGLDDDDDDDCTDVLPPLWDLLDDLVGGGGGSPLSPLRLKPLRLLGNGGNPCREDIAILSCMLKQIAKEHPDKFMSHLAKHSSSIELARMVLLLYLRI